MRPPFQQRIVAPAYWPNAAGAEKPDWNAMEANATTVAVAILDIGVSEVRGDGVAPWKQTPWGASYADMLVREAQMAGLTVLGYVDANWGTSVNDAPTWNGGARLPYRTEADIQQYILQWYSLCPTLDGIFFDDGPQPWWFTGSADPGVTTVVQAVKDFFVHIYAAVKRGGADRKVMLNAAGFQEDWTPGVCDITVVWESAFDKYQSAFPNPAPNWWAGDPGRVAHIIYSCPDAASMQTAVSLSKDRRAGFVYVQSNGATYTGLPDYWAQEVAAVKEASPGG